MKIYLALSLIVLFLCIVFVDATESQEALFKSIFAPQECQRACWYGIEPGVTTEDQLLQILSGLNLSYETTDIYHGKSYYIGAEIYSLPFIRENSLRPRIDVGEGIVGYIDFPVNIPLDLIHLTWGLPSKVEDMWMISILYSDKGLYFSAQRDMNHADSMTMARDNILDMTYVIPVEEAGPPPMSSCEDVSQAICDFVSPTFPQIVRDILLSPNCTQACYLGMQPEITTRQEVDAYLEQNQIVPHMLDTIDRDNTHYQWYLPAQSPFKPQNGGASHIIFHDGKIVRLTVSLEIPLSTVYEVFGYPDTITNYDDRFMTMIYKNLGIVIRVSTRNQTRAFDVLLASADSEYETYLMSPPGEPCSTYGTFPCIVPTATPLP